MRTSTIHLIESRIRQIQQRLGEISEFGDDDDGTEWEALQDELIDLEAEVMAFFGKNSKAEALASVVVLLAPADGIG